MHLLVEESQPDTATCVEVRLDDDVTIIALIDSGNSYRTCISETLYNRLKPEGDLVATRASVGTAKEGTSLEVVGVMEKLLNVKVGDEDIFLRPAVIKNFGTDMNISAKLVAQLGWTLDFNKRRLLTKTGECIPLLSPSARLVSEVRPDSGRPFYAESRVHVTGRQAILPHRVQYLKLKTAPHMSNCPHGASLHAVAQFPDVTGLMPTRASAISVSPSGTFYTRVCNPSAKKVVIEDGQRFGYVKALEQKAGQLCEMGMTTDGAVDEAIAEMPVTLEDFRNVSAAGQAPPGTNLDSPRAEAKLTDPAEVRAWLTKTFALQDQAMLTKNSSRMDLGLLPLIEHYNEDGFSLDGSFGRTHLLKHRIDVEPGTKPVKDRVRPLAPHLEDPLRTQLDEWIKQDCIEPSTSPWAANLVPVRKKSGKIRFCVDWRGLNRVTIKDSYPMPNINAILGRLAGSTCFSSIDCSGAFHAVMLEEDDKEKSAFYSPWGLFQFTCLGFGMTNGPSTYSRLVELVLQGISPEEALAFLDDALVHGKNFKEHLVNLTKTLRAYRKSGLKLSPEKCQFFRQSVDFLGHCVDKDGIRPTEKYKETIRKCTLPSTRTEARSWIGMVNYYRNSVRDFASKMRFWTDALQTPPDIKAKNDQKRRERKAGLAKLKREFEREEKPWPPETLPPHLRPLVKPKESATLTITPQMEESFRYLNNALVTAPVLGFPFFRGPLAGKFVLDTDFANGQIGGVLSQLQGDKEVPISYGSAKLTDAQKAYSSPKGELFAGLYFARKYSYYLKYSGGYTWRTDHGAWKNWDTLKNPPLCVERWLSELSEYPFTVVHRAGIDHSNADGLSRVPGWAVPMTEEEQKHFEVCSICAIPEEENSNFRLLDYAKDDLQRLQSEDRDIARIREWKESGRSWDRLDKELLSPNMRRLRDLPSAFVGKDNLLRVKWVNTDSGFTSHPLLLPAALEEEVIRETHIEGGHMAAKATADRVRRMCYFPNMLQKCTDSIIFCKECQQKSLGQQAQKHTLASRNTGYPFETLHLDFVGPMSKGSVTGARYLLTMRCNFSKWTEAVPVQAADAETTVQVLKNQIFSRFGVPQNIFTDAAQCFKSTRFKAFMKAMEIKATTTTAYNPKANSVIERAHRDLGQMVRALIAAEQQRISWEEVVPTAVFAINTATHSATKLSPFQVVFGRHPATPLTHLFGEPADPDMATTPIADYFQRLKQRIAVAHRFARINLKAAVSRQRRQYNEEKLFFTPGALVWLFTPVSIVGEARKLARPWTGPWRIEQKVTETAYKINPHESWAATATKHQMKGLVVSIDRLKLYFDKQAIQLLADDHGGHTVDIGVAQEMDLDWYAEGPFPPEAADDLEQGGVRDRCPEQPDRIRPVTGVQYDDNLMEDDEGNWTSDDEDLIDFAVPLPGSAALQPQRGVPQEDGGAPAAAPMPPPRPLAPAAVPMPPPRPLVPAAVPMPQPRPLAPAAEPMPPPRPLAPVPATPPPLPAQEPGPPTPPRLPEATPPGHGMALRRNRRARVIPDGATAADIYNEIGSSTSEDLSATPDSSDYTPTSSRPVSTGPPTGVSSPGSPVWENTFATPVPAWTQPLPPYARTVATERQSRGLGKQAPAASGAEGSTPPRTQPQEPFGQHRPAGFAGHSPGGHPSGTKRKAGGEEQGEPKKARQAEHQPAPPPWSPAPPSQIPRPTATRGRGRAGRGRGLGRPAQGGTSRLNQPKASATPPSSLPTATRGCGTAGRGRSLGRPAPGGTSRLHQPKASASQGPKHSSFLKRKAAARAEEAAEALSDTSIPSPAPSTTGPTWSYSDPSSELSGPSPGPAPSWSSGAEESDKASSLIPGNWSYSDLSTSESRGSSAGGYCPLTSPVSSPAPSPEPLDTPDWLEEEEALP